MLNIEKTIENGKGVFTLEGRLDTVTSRDFGRELSAELDNLTDLVLDFEKLEYISSAGLRVLLTAMNEMDGKGSMKVVHVNETIMETLEITGFAEDLTIE